MNYEEIPVFRLISQHIAEAKKQSVSDVVYGMGAMQAQDYNMAKWAIGLRTHGCNGIDVESAIDNAEIIRTHLLRPTWHFVSSKDIYWMLDLTAGKIKASFQSRHKELGLTESVLTKSCKIIEKALSGNNHLTREELINVLEKAKISIYDNRASHIFGWTELEGITCSGKIKNGKQTYALLEERVTVKNKLKKEEALAELAARYFRSRGPATLEDFSWWSGLSIKDCRQAAEIIKNDFISEKIETKNYFFSNSFSIQKTNNEAAFLLPAFDEFVIAYKDRSASLSREQHKKSISSNGVFRPMIVVNGQIIGIWKRTIQKKETVIEANYFGPQSKEVKILVEKEAVKFGQFLNQKIHVI